MWHFDWPLELLQTLKNKHKKNKLAACLLAGARQVENGSISQQDVMVVSSVCGRNDFEHIWTEARSALRRGRDGTSSPSVSAIAKWVR